MATLHSITTGSFSVASTWGLVDAASFSNTIVGNSTLTTSPVASASFTPGAITVKGVSVLIQSRAASFAGTMTVALYNAAGSSVAAVTINVADLPSTGALGTPYIGWTYFQFAAPVTLAAADAHTLRLNTSQASMVNVYSTGTTNWSRALVTTTTQAPAATDVLLISGQHTAAGTFTPYAVTMNITSNATSYGQLVIGTRGTLSYGVAASTNYALKLGDSLYVGAGGTLNIGTLASQMPATSTATLEISCASALQYSIFVYGTMTTYGAVKTVASKLASDVSAGATSSTSTTSTGWKSGDVIVVPSTTRTYTEFEQVTLSADASGTSLSHSAYTNAHGGNATTRVQADIVNATRNITILSTSTTFRTNIQMFALSVTSFYYTKFQDLGTGINVANSGVCINSLTSGSGSFDFQSNVMTISVVNSAVNSANTALFATSNTAITVSNNLFYKLGWTATVTAAVSSLVNDGNYVIGCLSTAYALLSTYMGSNNVIASNGAAATACSVNNFTNNATNNSFYSNLTTGLWYNSPSSTVAPLSTSITGLKIWRNNGSGLVMILTNAGNLKTQIFTILDSYIFGNTIAGINTNGNSRVSCKFYFNNCYIYGGTTLVQPYAISLNTNSIIDTIYFNSCYFGYSDSSLTTSPHTTATINSPLTSQAVLFTNCYFNTNPAEVIYSNGIASTNVETSYTSFNHNGITGANKTWYSNGVISTDTTIFNNASPSIRLTPANAIYKLTPPTVKVPVKTGQTCKVSVSIRESISANGAVYSGNRPRLMYAFNPSLGNLSEKVGDTTKNLFQYAQNFENANWSKTAMTITPDSGVAPDGTFTADLFVEDTTTNRHRIVSSGVPLLIGTYTLSVYAKKATQDWIQLNPVVGTFNVENWANFNLSTGVVGNKGTNAIANMVDVGNGWWRLSLQCDVITDGTTFPAVCLSTNNANSIRYPSYAGTSAQCFYIWGAQLTAGASLLPYYDNGQWELLTYTTESFLSDGVAEFYVDCDGTAGWVNVDDWSATTANDSRGTGFWNPSGSYIESDWRKPGGAQTFCG